MLFCGHASATINKIISFAGRPQQKIAGRQITSFPPSSSIFRKRVRESEKALPRSTLPELFLWGQPRASATSQGSSDACTDGRMDTCIEIHRIAFILSIFPEGLP